MMTRSISLLFAQSVLITPLSFADRTTQIEEVLVTAQKREEDVQHLGFSVQAISKKAIRERAITQASDVLDQFANVGRNAANGINAGFTIRGVGTNNFHGNVARAVSVYQDDVSYSNPYAGTLSTFDLERIEILRGPQNTLFGRNAIGGAVNYITTKPVVGEKRNGHFQTSVGDHGYLHAEGALGQGLGERHALRIAFASHRRDGIFENLVSDAKHDRLGEKESDAARLQWLFEPTAKTSMLFNIHTGSHAGTSVSNKAIGLRDPNDPTQPCDVQSLIHGSDFQTRNECVTVDGFNPSSNDWHKLADISGAKQDLDTSGGSVHASFEFEQVTLTFITSLDSTELEFNEELEGSANLRMIAFQDSEFEQMSQEWRLVSNQESTFRWIAGMYLFEETLEQATNVRRVVIANNAPVTAYNLLDQTEYDYSIYGQFDFYITRNTLLTTGIRYTENKKTARSLFGVVSTPEATYSADRFINRELVIQLTGDTPGQCPPPVGGVPCTLDLGRIQQNTDDEGFNVRLTHDVTDNLMIYGNYGHGFKSGGFDTRALAAFSNNADTPVKPEYLSAYELGVKFSTSQKLRLNSALFHYDWKDLQTFDSTNGSPAFLNIPKVTIQGFELEIAWSPMDTFVISGNAGFLQSEITDAGNLDSVDKGHELQNTPNESYTLSLVKQFLLFGNDLTLRSDVQHIGEQVDSLNYALDPYTHKPSQTYWNTHIDYQFVQFPLNISVWGKNLTEEKSCLQIAPLTTPGTASPDDTTSTMVCNPNDGIRQLGLSTTVKF